MNDRPVPWRRALVLAAGLPVGLVVRAIAARSQEATELWFANGLFPVLRAPLTGLVRLSPVSVAELLVLALAIWVGARIVRAFLSWRRGERSPRNLAAHGGAQVTAAVGVISVLFLGLWGLNYQRQPFASLVGLERVDAKDAEVRELAVDLVSRLNDLRAKLAEDEAGVMVSRRTRTALFAAVGELYESAARLVPELAGPAPVLRPALSSRLLSAVGIAGIYSPFTAEAHVNARQPSPSIPFSALHEAAHARGFAREDEANFIAWRVARLGDDPEFAYSAHLVALAYASAPVLRADPEGGLALLDGLSDAVQRDRDAIRTFWQGQSERARRVGGRANDLYLKAQGQREGTQSYGRMVDWLLAERRAGWD